MTTYGSTNYPDDWETRWHWNGKISVQFGYASYGWVMLSLMTNASLNSSLVIHLSDVYPPFEDMIDWLKAIANNKTPVSFKIDEEGCYKELIVRPYSGRYSEDVDIEFRIIGDTWDAEKKEVQEECVFLCRAKRSQLLDEFVRRLEQWLKEDYDPNEWHQTWRQDNPDDPLLDLRNLDITGIKARMEK